MATPPLAEERPRTLVSHGDQRSDPWFWLRVREDPAVLPYLEAENAYTEEGLAPLDGLRTTLFEEMKARILETDMSVPSRRGPWWYYGRTEEGKNYAIHCRRPAGPADELPPVGEAGVGEVIMLDENALASFLQRQGFQTSLIRARADLVYLDVTNSGGDRPVRLRVAILNDPQAAGADLHKAILDHGSGSWGVPSPTAPTSSSSRRAAPTAPRRLPASASTAPSSASRSSARCDASGATAWTSISCTTRAPTPCGAARPSTRCWS